MALISRRARFVLTTGVVLAVAAVAGVVMGRSARYAESTLYPRRVALGPGDRAEAARVLPGHVETILRTGDGLHLAAWYAPGKNDAAVVLLHGFGANRAAVLPEAAELSRRGYAVLLFDGRAHGESEGDLCTWGDREAADLSAALDFVTAQKGVRTVGALGFSLGATTVAEVAAHDPRVRAVVVEAGTPSIREGFEHDLHRYGWLGVSTAMYVYERHGIRAESVSLTGAMPALAPRPALVVAGAQDPFVPESQSREVFDAARSPKELYVVAGALHGQYARIPAGPAYLDRIGRFFDESLAPHPQ
jgi:pimeloyl-ACP methyl ester carboxylesterase